MGKLLEAADGVGDVYFYQLSEAASRSGGRPVFVGILHQSFQEYANSFGAFAMNGVRSMDVLSM